MSRLRDEKGTNSRKGKAAKKENRFLMIVISTSIIRNVFYLRVELSRKDNILNNIKASVLCHCGILSLIKNV